MTDPKTRLQYPLYRCHTCSTIIAAADIVTDWEEREKGNFSDRGVCPCGSSRISPANLNPEEEEKLLAPELLQRLLAGDEGPATRVWRAALIEIRAGRAEGSEEEQQAALAYLPEFEAYSPVENQ